MAILVTGAGGFLGFNLTHHLLKKGHEVIGLVRKENPALSHLKKNFPLFQMAFADITSLQNTEKIFSSFSQKIEAIFHTAGKVAPWGSPADYFLHNVEGTQYLLHLAQKYQVPKFIYTSSPSVVYGHSSLQGVDESTPYPKSYLSAYAHSKHLAEKLVLNCDSPQFSTVALRPHLILGPGDHHLIPTLLKAHQEKKLKIIGQGKNQVDVIHIQNAVNAHDLAYQKLTPDSPLKGQALFLGQGPVSLWPFINEIFKNLNQPPVTKKIPQSLAYSLGFICEKFFILKKEYKKNPPMTRFIAKQLSTDHYFSHKKSLTLLGNYNTIGAQELINSYKVQ